MKYGNTKVTVDGHTFDSKREYNRYCELKLMERAGLIKDLELQKKYELIPKQGKGRAVNYFADFVYTENGKTVVEDTKGFKTKEYIIKRKLMRYIHGIEIKEL